VIALTLYSRPGCHLCDDMKALVAAVIRRHRFDATVDEVDISRDASLESLYGEEIPVLLVDGRKIAKYRITEAELLRALNARPGGAGAAG
jgi:glutaredoxin